MYIFRLVWSWVYPRVCGGTYRYAELGTTGQGLSPRMRGNHAGGLHGAVSGGSIPAYAGEPADGCSPRLTAAVYPRVCGGTRFSCQSPMCVRGLSPRMRGNLRSRSDARFSRGSIPAYAGEPSVPPHRRRIRRVYPRVCGGTGFIPRVQGSRRGLSPRMRGNLRTAASPVSVMRSIPAYAGEPHRTGGNRYVGPVYPRVCGGTRIAKLMWPLSPGLSPRMRGNPSSATIIAHRPGSIPAYAGEPDGRLARSSLPGVYPRVCGGTRSVILRKYQQRGLSPRMRGNPTRPVLANQITL